MNEIRQIKSEILKPEPRYEEEPMDTCESLYDYDEEGEIHSSSDEQNDHPHFQRSTVRSIRDVPLRTASEGFLTGVNIFDKGEDLKRLERAKRFAIPMERNIAENVNTENLSRLHRSLGIDKENERHYRFNAVHMRGTQEMSTNDVFEYFSFFAPSSVEWINDISCNIVWADDISAARALLNLSKEIKNLEKIHLNADPFEKDLKEKEIVMDEDAESDVVDAREIKAAIPPGYWRIGVPSEKSSAILLRFATRSDKKQRNAEKNSEYYKRYGNPHFGNIPGLVSNSLRSNLLAKRYKKFASKASFNEDFDGDIDDEVEVSNGRKNPWGNLAHEWNELDKSSLYPNRDMRTRISLKRQHPRNMTDLRLSINKKPKQKTKLFERKLSENSSSENDKNNDDFDDNEHQESRVKFPSMKMYADEEEKIETKTNKNYNRPSLQIRVGEVEDLRNKIDRKKRTKKMLDSYQMRADARNNWRKNSSAEEDEDCDYYNDEKDSPNWALEQYADLRESLEQNRKYRNSQNSRTIYKSDSEQNEDSANDDLYTGYLGHRSPLQIEIENDAYFENGSDNTL